MGMPARAFTAAAAALVAATSFMPFSASAQAQKAGGAPAKSPTVLAVTPAPAAPTVPARNASNTNSNPVAVNEPNGQKAPSDNILLQAGEASKKYGSLSIAVIKGGKSDYPRSAKEVADIIGKYIKREYGLNSLLFNETSGDGVGVSVVYFVDGKLIESLNLEDAVTPEIMKKVADTYSISSLVLYDEASKANNIPPQPQKD